jgi:hypothetical protein
LKKIIAVVVLAALIIATFAFLPLPSAKADASEARVLSYSYYTAPANANLAQNPGRDILVFGEVQNVGSHIIQNVTIGGTALDSSGNTIASAEGLAYSYETAPGQRVPFLIDFTPSSSTTSNSDWMSSLANFNVTVLAVTDTTTSAYPNLHVPEAPTAINESGVYTVVGTIVNNGTQTMDYVWVVTTFYNAAGTVVGLNYTYVVTPVAALVPSGAARWVATPADNTPQLTNEIASYSYVIDSEPRITSSSTQPTSTPTASGTPSQFPVLPIVVVVVAVVVVAAALMLLRKRQKIPPPPPPPPPPPTS